MCHEGLEAWRLGSLTWGLYRYWGEVGLDECSCGVSDAVAEHVIKIS
jgi:hypothetical protein